MLMYDTRLDAILKAAELGSFSKAAKEMGYSTPALMKQVNGFESQMGFTIFVRSNKGVELTENGRAFVEDARDIIARCDLALEKARNAQMQADNIVRVGVSLYQSGQYILKLCHDMFVKGIDISIQFMPVADTYESYRYTVEHFGEEVDVLASTKLPASDERNCSKVVLGNPNLCLAVPLTSDLARYDSVDVSVLAGRRVLVPMKGNPYTDAAREDIVEGAPGVELVEFPNYTMSVFDRCAMSGDILLSKEIWRDVHPLLKTLDVQWTKTIPYCLYYAKDPRPAVLKFVQAACEVSLQ